MRQVLGIEAAQVLDVTKCCPDELLNMTFLALRCSHFVNGVAMRHGEVSQDMFPDYPIRAITNGVHAQTWVSPPFAALFDQLVPGWRRDNFNLRYVMGIPLDRIRATHLEAKRALIDRLRAQAGADLDETVFTIGFARRATAYKRADLVFHDLVRLRWIARNSGPFQIVMGGKAHPRDEGGKELIRRIFEAARVLDPLIRVIYVEDYDIEWAKALCSGVDLWLNTPKRPHEASGTSGMKAAMNGVPSLSVLDGWWVEGHIENVTGWSIGEDHGRESDDKADADALYDKLERVILPQFYGRRDDYAKVMRSAIALNGSYFNTQRMVFQYSVDAYADQPSAAR
jgi:starch phosphorylase